ncbi:unnamed protein product [Amoebophrya sp. A120]|nr:unnamed protein product [Amoebophrya sp. A120]|eukprot:GSA120T00008693001.1
MTTRAGKLGSCSAVLFLLSAATAVLGQGAPDFQTVLGGFYTDPNHYKPGTLEGIRLMGFPATPGSSEFAFTGSDDGAKFWKASGKILDSAEWETKKLVKLQTNFHEKGAPADFAEFKGTFDGVTGRITWQDGNAWVRQKEVSLDFAGGSSGAGSSTDATAAAAAATLAEKKQHDSIDSVEQNFIAKENDNL